MRAGAVVEIARGSEVANPANLPFDVSPNYHNRAFAYNFKSQTYFIQAPSGLSGEDAIANIQAQVTECDRAVGDVRRAAQHADEVAQQLVAASPDTQPLFESFTKPAEGSDDADLAGSVLMTREALEGESELEQSLAGRELPVKEIEGCAVLCSEGMNALEEAKTEVANDPEAAQEAAAAMVSEAQTTAGDLAWKRGGKNWRRQRAAEAAAQGAEEQAEREAKQKARNDRLE
eukprot:15432993-Alexandrium_andersonii.AAC.1